MGWLARVLAGVALLASRGKLYGAHSVRAWCRPPQLFWCATQPWRSRRRARGRHVLTSARPHLPPSAPSPSPADRAANAVAALQSGSGGAETSADLGTAISQDCAASVARARAALDPSSPGYASAVDALLGSVASFGRGCASGDRLFFDYASALAPELLAASVHVRLTAATSATKSAVSFFALAQPALARLTVAGLQVRVVSTLGIAATPGSDAAGNNNDLSTRAAPSDPDSCSGLCVPVVFDDVRNSLPPASGNIDGEAACWIAETSLHRCDADISPPASSTLLCRSSGSVAGAFDVSYKSLQVSTAASASAEALCRGLGSFTSIIKDAAECYFAIAFVACSQPMTTVNNLSRPTCSVDVLGPGNYGALTFNPTPNGAFTIIAPSTRTLGVYELDAFASNATVQSMAMALTNVAGITVNLLRAMSATV